jgi:hypothetical protein
VAGPFKHGNETSVSVKDEILEYLSDCQLLKKNRGFIYLFS